MSCDVQLIKVLLVFNIFLLVWRVRKKNKPIKSITTSEIYFVVSKSNQNCQLHMFRWHNQFKIDISYFLLIIILPLFFFLFYLSHSLSHTHTYIHTRENQRILLYHTDNRPLSHRNTVFQALTKQAIITSTTLSTLL